MKKVILTGGTRGIGKAILKKLHENKDYSFEVITRTDSSLLECQNELNSEKIQYLKLDLTDEKQMESYAHSLGNTSIYALINNAGICKTATLREKNFSVWRTVLDTNLNAVFTLTSLLAPKIQEHGRIINISSQLGKEGRAGYSAYCASKFALLGLTKVWAKELGPQGILVNAICPGWVETEMSQLDLARIAKEKQISPETFYQEICKPLELKRFTHPEEVANLVEFLISEKASGITGRDWLMNTIWNQE